MDRALPLRSLARTAACSALALAAACAGSGADPCPVATGQVALENRPLGELQGVREAALDCTGASGGTTLDCSGDALVEQHACEDGFGFVVSRNVRLLLRLQAAGGTWTAGAQLAAGEALTGSLTFAGLPNPAAPVPAAGAEQAGSVTLHGAKAVVDAELRVRW